MHEAENSGLSVVGKVSLTPEEVRRLLVITVDLLTICARVSARIDPKIGAMIAYARDEVLENAIADRAPLKR